MSKRISLTSFSNVPTDLVRLDEISTKTKLDFVLRKIQIADVEFTTIDVKLHMKFKEDDIYKDDEIRTLIPRGLCYIFANNSWVYTLYGHPKFGDIGEFLPEKITMTDVNLLTKVYRRKENGECAHWGAFIYNECVYEVYGSKNVHIVVRSTHWEKDLSLYTEQRYSFAIKMANLINVYNKTLALEYLISSKNSLCGEGCFMDSQHFVKYQESTMFFFAVTGKREHVMDSIVKISPIEIDGFFSSLGLVNVSETIICDKSNGTDVRKIEEHFETMLNSEGAVVSCVDENGKVVYMYKHKNYDYVYQRALREQMKQYASTTKILERFARMHIVHSNHNALLERFLKFNAWFRQATFTNQEKENFFENWVTMIERFDKLTLDEQNEWLRLHNESEKMQNVLNVIMMVGIPGSGKSFVARSIDHILTMNGKKCVHLEQDMFNGSSQLYHKTIAKTIEQPDIDYLILAKANHNKTVRNATYTILSKCTRPIIKTFVIMTTNDENMHDTLELCVKRILNRGFAHATLFGKKESELRGILMGVFIKDWQTLTETELCNNVIKLEINQEKQHVVRSFCNQAINFGMNDFSVTDEKLFYVFNQIMEQDKKMAEKNKKK